MATRANKPISVTLGRLGERAQARVESGEYASMSEVVRAGLRALDREEAALEDWFEQNIEFVRARVQEAIDDPQPSLSSEEVAKSIKAHHEARLKREQN